MEDNPFQHLQGYSELLQSLINLKKRKNEKDTINNRLYFYWS